MNQKFFFNILMLVAANLLIKPFWILGIDLQVQNVVGAETYGLFYAVFNFSFLFHILLDIGINQFNNREIAQSPEKISDFFGNLLFLKILLSFIYLLVTFGIAYQIGFGAFQMKLLAFLALNQVFYSGILFARSNFTALHWFKWDIFFSILDRLLAIIICVFLIYTSLFGLEFKIEYFVYAQTFSLAISAIFSLLVLLLKAQVSMPTFNYLALKSLLKQSFPYALAVLLMSIYMRVDAIMIERILPENGQYEAGIYAAAYRLLDAANMIPFLFASILIPVTARFLKENKAFQPLMNASLNFLLCISILTAVTVYFF
jgi:O-antigen/teichoic acid export membrane protein